MESWDIVYAFERAHPGYYVETHFIAETHRYQLILRGDAVGVSDIQGIQVNKFKPIIAFEISVPDIERYGGTPNDLYEELFGDYVKPDETPTVRDDE